jgi:aldehyde dehydrogenase (NAD+)
MVRAMGDYLLEPIDEIAPLLTLESGKPLWEARIEVEGAARYFEYYGNQAEHRRRPVDPAGRWLFRFHRARTLSASRRRSSRGTIRWR